MMSPPPLIGIRHHLIMTQTAVTKGHFYPAAGSKLPGSGRRTHVSSAKNNSVDVDTEPHASPPSSDPKDWVGLRPGAAVSSTLSPLLFSVH